MQTVAVAIITGLVSILAGGGGVFWFLSNNQKNKNDRETSAVSEWMHLYEEMKSRLDEQEKENEELKQELNDMRQEIAKLAIELTNYKNYDRYIADVEAYVEHLLHTIETLSNHESYIACLKKKPVKPEHLKK